MAPHGSRSPTTDYAATTKVVTSRTNSVTRFRRSGKTAAIQTAPLEPLAWVDVAWLFPTGWEALEPDPDWLEPASARLGARLGSSHAQRRGRRASPASRGRAPLVAGQLAHTELFEIAVGYGALAALACIVTLARQVIECTLSLQRSQYRQQRMEPFVKPRGCNRWQSVANRLGAEAAGTGQNRCRGWRLVAVESTW
jgi:hypothetical protein